MRIENYLRTNAVRRGDEPAVIADEATLSWAELDRESNRLTRALQGFGLLEQERVALVITNGHRVVLAYHGLWKANLVAVGINPRLTQPEMQRILAHSGAAAVICDSEVAVAAAAEVPGVRVVLTVGAVAGQGTAAFDDAVAAADPGDTPCLGTGSDLRALRYTSGTTGAAKGCMATHDQQLAHTANYLVEVGVPREGPTWVSVPLSLGVGASFVTTSAHLGVPLVLRRRFDPSDFLDDVERFGVKHAFLVPTMLVDLAAALPETGDPRAASLSLIGYGGAAISWNLIRSITSKLDVDAYHAFGATEAGGFTALLTPEDHRKFLQTETSSIVPVGRPAAYAEVVIFDENDQPCAPEEVGEMRIRAASVFSGYWGQPEVTRSVLKDGWLRLGDMARRDEQGYIYLADRALGVIRSGAQNVYAGEVEAVLQACPGVHRAAVVGVPDERYGESVKALVQPSPGSELTAEAILAFCSGQLSKYKQPREIEFVTDLPVDEGGKIRRAELQRHAGTSVFDAAPQKAESNNRENH